MSFDSNDFYADPEENPDAGLEIHPVALWIHDEQ
jgi:hypothetical protein